MGLIKNITRGGQTHLHDLRMMFQVLKVAVKVKLILLLGIFFGLVYITMDHKKINFYKDYQYARFLVFFDKEATQVLTFSGITKAYPAQKILKNPALIHNKKNIETELLSHLFNTFFFALFLTILILLFWYRFGKKKSGKIHKRGTEILSKEDLKKVIHIKKCQSQFKIDDLPLLKNYETRHFLITGTTGSGKTNCLNGLIKQIITYKQSSIIVDITGGFVRKFYEKNTDTLLNPFDKRSTDWNMWADVYDEATIEEFTKSLIPDPKAGSDPFWNNAARTVLTEAILKFRASGKTDLKMLYHILAESPLKEFESYLQGTSAANLIDPSADRMAISIRATLITYIKLFKHLKVSAKGISLREWMHQVDVTPNRRLFLTCSQKYRELLKPLISAWFNLGINSLMALQPNDERRVWMIMDELAALQKLNHLSLGLSELRKYGGCIIACLQNKAQLEEIYGHLALKNMLDNFNTKLFFRSTGREISSWVSDTLGKAESVEKVENISYGSHAMRDGVSISNQTKLSHIFLPEDIQQFEDLEVVIKYPGDYPITRFKTRYNLIEDRNDAFIDNGQIKTIKKEISPIPDQKKDLLETLFQEICPDGLKNKEALKTSSKTSQRGGR